MITANTGIITRALPTEDGLQIKVSTEQGALTLDVPASRTDLIEATRSARMTGIVMALRYTRDATLVAIAPHVDALAA